METRQRAGNPGPGPARAGSPSIVFVAECFIDELAARAGVDAVEYRRALLHASPGAATVLDVAAARAHWDRPLPAGYSRGVALQHDAGGLAAFVVEVEVRHGGSVRVSRVVGALGWDGLGDPAHVRSMLQHRVREHVRTALSMASISLSQGDPVVEVALVPCGVAGAGHDVLECIGPAFASAVFACTGRRPGMDAPRRARRSSAVRASNRSRREARASHTTHRA